MKPKLVIAITAMVAGLSCSNSKQSVPQPVARDTPEDLDKMLRRIDRQHRDLKLRVDELALEFHQTTGDAVRIHVDQALIRNDKMANEMNSELQGLSDQIRKGEVPGH